MTARGSVAGRWVSREMVFLVLVLATLPLWIGPVGLYQYLGVEIAIWMIYGLGFNLLLGYSGLPSFGHGAFFGIGAYAFGLFQLRVFESLWLGIAAAVAGAWQEHVGSGDRRSLARRAVAGLLSAGRK